MKKKKEYTSKQEKLARFAKALGHPARVAIIQFLAGQECCYFGGRQKRGNNFFGVLSCAIPNGNRSFRVLRKWRKQR